MGKYGDTEVCPCRNPDKCGCMPKRQPVVVQHGEWVLGVCSHLRRRAREGDLAAENLMREYERINGEDDNRA